MATSFSDVFNKFLNLIKDRGLVVDFTDEELTDILTLHLEEISDLYFTNCEKDLSDRDGDSFTETLSSREQWIIANGMILSWLKPIIYDESKLRDRLTSKDYNALHSQGNLIDKLILLKKEAQRDLKSLTVDYSYKDFTGFN